jgi:phosphoglycolate phosphatase-like HAD superfamily hydrolase
MVSPPEMERSHPDTGNLSKGQVTRLLQDARLVFWDFDGVVKDSIGAKTEGFRWLVRSAGPKVCNRVQRHHESNGGVSRYDKIPLYLKWADMPTNATTVRRACVEFSEYVTDAVINSPWVPGVADYLRSNLGSQVFILVTATPSEEIIRILDQLTLLPCFSDVFGAPTLKGDAVAFSLDHHQIASDRAVFVGDSVTDHEAATSNCVPFLLRRHGLNRDLAASLRVPSFFNLGRD